MRCISLDFVDGGLINPAYAYKTSVGYILSDFIELIGSTVLLLALERRFFKMPLEIKVEIVASFQKHDPETKKAFDEFLAIQKRKKHTKHLPTNIFVHLKRLEFGTDRIVNDWMISLQTMLKKEGFFSFYQCFDLGIFNIYFFAETRDAVRYNTILIDDLFINKTPTGTIDNTILLLAKGFYNETIFEEVAVTDINQIEEGKPYLIKCLDLPNLNTLTSPEMRILKAQIHPHISVFKAEAEAWTNKCYTEKNGINYFKEKLMPTMQ